MPKTTPELDTPAKRARKRLRELLGDAIDNRGRRVETVAA